MKKTADQAHENIRPAARAGNSNALAKVERRKIEEDSSFIDFSKEKPVKKEQKNILTDRLCLTIYWLI
jgi:hypothetical protein